jgi:hypothetical protein
MVSHPRFFFQSNLSHNLAPSLTALNRIENYQTQAAAQLDDKKVALQPEV